MRFRSAVSHGLELITLVLVFLALVFALLCAAAGARAEPSATELARSIREAPLDPAECYRVRDFSFRQDEIHVYFTDGFLIFSKPVAGQRISALFVTENVEGGDGEILLFPPTRSERESLAAFTKSPNMDEHINAALMVFTNGTGAVLLDRLKKEGSGIKVPEMGALMADQWSSVLANVREGFELRIVADLLSPNPGSAGFLFMTLAGRERGKFDVLYDPRAREQIVVGQLATDGQRSRYNVWTSFMTKSVRTGAVKRTDPGFSLRHFSIDATLDASLRMKVVTKIKLEVGAASLSSFPFEIAGPMKVTGVRVDGTPVELLSRDAGGNRAGGGNENNGLLVVTPTILPAGSEHQFEFEHEGGVISSAGDGVYFVGARSTWYPRSGPEFSTYDLTFRYPKKLTLVAVGDLVDDRTDGETRITRRRTDVPIRFAGFNLGEYEKITGDIPGFSVEIYGNRGLEAALRPQAPALPDPLPNPRTGQKPRNSFDIRGPSAAPNPIARLRAVSADVSSSLQFYSSLFGPPVLKTLTVAPIPGTFGQGFPGLIYLSTISYLDPSSRPSTVRDENEEVFFSDLIVAHEVAHQWWGNVVIASSYQDEWLMEALSNYSALLWLEKKNGPKAVEAVLENYRARLLSKDLEGRTLESAGPIVWGARLDSSARPGAWRSITYEKGAWIMHMLRQRLGNDRFLKMLAELRRRYEFHPVTSEEFRALAKEFLPPHTPVDAMDTFFDNWVYATGIPTLKVQSSTRGLKVSGTVTQSGVGDDFSVDVPVQIQFAKASQTIWLRTSSDPVSFSATIKEAPIKVSLGPYSVLATQK